jgi:hypothetical protein
MRRVAAGDNRENGRRPACVADWRELRGRAVPANRRGGQASAMFSSLAKANVGYWFVGIIRVAAPGVKPDRATPDRNPPRPDAGAQPAGIS